MDISENRWLFDADPSAVTQAIVVEKFYWEAGALKMLNHKNISAGLEVQVGVKRLCARVVKHPCLDFAIPSGGLPFLF